MLTRRQFNRSLFAMAASSGVSLSLAATGSSNRLVLILLRGAMDGLSCCVPYGDPGYQRLRGELALASPGSEYGVLKLNGLFGLHPRLEHLHSLYETGQASVVHAVASPYRSRSHFDGQDMLESGGAGVGAARDGWLNRALAPLGGRVGDEAAIAMAGSMPLILQGPQSATSWAPSRLPDASDDTLRRLADLYADDAFFATRLQQALNAQDIAGEMGEGSRRRNRARQLRETATAAAKFLTTDGGPSIAVIESDGWDTHANQGAANGQLADQFAALDGAIEALHTGLGDEWERTAVVVATEFGRTAATNGTRGTDHGTASAALLAGGAVAGGKVIADWPGLQSGDLYENRDLYPTSDLRSLFKTLLVGHIEIAPSYVEDRVFPDSQKARAIPGILRS